MQWDDCALESRALPSQFGGNNEQVVSGQSSTIPAEPG